MMITLTFINEKKSVTNYEVYQGPGLIQQFKDYRKSDLLFEQNFSSCGVNEALLGTMVSGRTAMLLH